MADTGRVEQSEQVKVELHASLRRHRAHILASVEDLTEAQLRRPMTPTGTNLLGLVKHLAGLEYGYLGGVFGRPGAERLSWVDDKSIWDGADMWATAEESSDYLIGLYRRACAHADQTIDALGLDSPGSVLWWAETQRSTTLLTILLRMVGETAQHAGHADIVREPSTAGAARTMASRATTSTGATSAAGSRRRPRPSRPMGPDRPGEQIDTMARAVLRRRSDGPPAHQHQQRGEPWQQRQPDGDQPITDDRADGRRR